MVTIRYGAELVFCTPTPTGRKEAADKIAADTGGVIVHPYDNDDVIAGQVIVTAIVIMRTYSLLVCTIKCVN